MDTQGAAAALVGYALGIPAAVGQTVLQPAFFARQNTRTPMVHSLGSVGVAVVLSYVLYPHFGIFGLALAASIASWVGFLSLASHLVWVRLFQPDQRFFMRLIPMIGASAVMVAALHGGLYMLDDLQAFGFALRLPLSLVLITASAMLYFALIFGLGVFNKSDLQFLRNRS